MLKFRWFTILTAVVILVLPNLAVADQQIYKLDVPAVS